jgi:phosphoglycolate phosphatase-like HAD superfamily hydrolase
MRWSAPTTRARPCQKIARQVLRAEKLSDDAIDAHLRDWCALFAYRYLQLLNRANTDDWQVVPQAQAALSRLSDAGINLALLTGNPEPMAHARMHRLDLDGSFPRGKARSAATPRSAAS